MPRCFVIFVSLLVLAFGCQPSEANPSLRNAPQTTAKQTKPVTSNSAPAKHAQNATQTAQPTGPAKANKPPRPQVCIQPFSPYKQAMLAPVAAGIDALYGLKVKRLTARKLPKSAWYKPRRRWRAERLLSELNAIRRSQAGCDLILGFTASDISTTNGQYPDWGIFGLGEVGGTAAVISTHRLRKNASPRKLARRTVSVALHELGHVLGLGHCRHNRCLMADANGKLASVDSGWDTPCPTCWLLLSAKGKVSGSLPQSLGWNKIIMGVK